MSRTAAAATVRSLQGDTVSALVWRHLGQGAGRTEAVLEANPHLIDLPERLPAGVPVLIPANLSAHIARQPVRLWD